MKFVVKFFPEITIKSKPVRKQFIAHLRKNLRLMLTPLDSSIEVRSQWDQIVVQSAATPEEGVKDQVIAVLSCTPGIALFLDVIERPFEGMHGIFEQVLDVWGERLAGKTFAVRCKRSGQHDFNSHELERYIGGGLLEHCASNGVELRNPDITVSLELREDRLFVVNRRYEGLGGYPLGSLDPVVSLISGGFDSTVSSYLTMRRGMRTHFCFFNLGGREHEVGVREVAYYLWMKYGSSSRVKFVSVPFEGVVSEILQQVDNSHMGVVLKRMMLRAGSNIAERLYADALVTGEAVAQVSSQTLKNLSVIDSATDTLVLRPLISSDKQDIIKIARDIGTEAFAAAMPEYCGVISVRPTTRAKMDRVVHEESKFDFAVLEKALEDAVFTNIDKIAEQDLSATGIEELSVPVQGAVVIDVRHPAEEERQPLKVPGVNVLTIPFYALHSQFSKLDQDKIYLLYCAKGVMSRLHAAHLLDRGYGNVKVYRP